MRPGEGYAGASRRLILLVEDEPSVTDLIQMALGREGWDVVTVSNVEAVEPTVSEAQPDLVLLELALPAPGGLEILRRIRAGFPAIPVIVLTKRDSIDDWLASVAAGAEDFLTKPVDITFLIDRVRRLSPQANDGANEASPALTVGDLVIMERTQQVYRGGELIELDGTAVDVLRYLMRRAGEPQSREEILQAIWNFDFGGNLAVVDVYIRHLRANIDGGRRPMIRTVSEGIYVIEPAEQWG